MTAQRGIMSEQSSSFVGCITPTMKRIMSQRRLWDSGVARYCRWNQSWYRLWLPKRTCEGYSVNMASEIKETGNY